MSEHRAEDNGTAANYSRRFFANQQEGSDRSAQRIVGLVMELVGPRSVVDVGCGVGAWLGAFLDAGVDTVLGLDGDYVPRDMLKIPRERFVAANLQERLPVDERFDLAMSLEVAEHLPEGVAEQFVETLCRLAPVVMFSAAIPLQGGTGHINEQPQSYWAEKFASHAYRVIDAIRPEVWSDDSVKFWYRQNAFLYASDGAFSTNARLRDALAGTDTRMLDLVHPELLAHRNQQPTVEMSRFLPQWAKRKAVGMKRAVRGG